MKKLRIMTVYGTRPEAIKMAPLVAALKADPRTEPIVAVTGQHREMLDQVNALFDIIPDHDMNLMAHGATVAQINARALLGTSELLERERPDVVVVQGDTTSAFSAGLAAFYARIPVVHLEAGLRTGDMSAPFPEEANRRLLAPLAALHLAPTPTSRDNLLRETIDSGSIVVTGNTVIDALWSTVDKPVTYTDPSVASFLTEDGPLVLVTAHRRESWGYPMVEAMGAIRALAEKHSEARVLVPMHRNAVVRDVVESELGDRVNVLLTEPLSYHEFCHAMSASTLVITDSGGVQEEAPSLGKPVLVMRDTTERPEAVDAGTVRLVGTDRELILNESLRLLEDSRAYAEMANATNPYGDGRAAARCLAAVLSLMGAGERLEDFDPLRAEADCNAA